MAEFDYGRIREPEFFAQNRMEAHSDHAYYASREEAERGESSFVISLDGLWKFSYARNIAEAPKDFMRDDYDCGAWEDIRVPAHIQMEGYDRPQYANVEYPWDGHEEIEPGQIPERFNPTASYVKYFTVPEGFGRDGLTVTFDGAESGLALWCNGAYVGYSEDSFTPASFDLTPYVREGENKLAAQVYKWTAGSWCEDQDFFRFSGIFRSVWLKARPAVHIADLEVRTNFPQSGGVQGQDAEKVEGAGAGADRFDRAQLEIKIKADAAGRIAYSLYELGDLTMVRDTRPLFDERALVFRQERVLQSGENRETFAVESPALWSAEEPNLYLLVMETIGESGALQETAVQYVGFRTFEIGEDHVMRLNGQRIVFHGVDRHEFGTYAGRALSEEDMVRDLVTMKQNNINAVRTSHYPNSSAFYSLCDRYGIYLIAEMNLETHGTWGAYLQGSRPYEYVLPGDHEAWRELVVDRARSGFMRDRNHPSILIWSCGNESFGGRDILEMTRFFHEADPTRPVHYEGVANDGRYPETTDIESRMYMKAGELRAFLKEHREKPMIECEYTHAMGNSNGGMQLYTEYAYEEPLYQGGFIWDYIDQSIAKKDRYGEEFQAYGGDFDDRPTDYNFSGNGIVYGGDRSPSPKMQAVRYNYRGIDVQIDPQAGTAQIFNRYLFTDTSRFEALVTVLREGAEIYRGHLEISVPAQSREQVSLGLEAWRERLARQGGAAAGEYVIRLSFLLKEERCYASRGHEVAFGEASFVVREQTEAAGTVLTGRPVYGSGLRIARPQKLSVVRGDFNIGVRGENFEALFSILYGGMNSYRYGGVEMLAAMPKPNFWRAPTDNDLGNNMPGRYAQWKIASLYSTYKQQAVPEYAGYHRGVEPTVNVENGPDGQPETVTITYTYFLPTKPAAQCALSYRVWGDGTVETTLSYDPVKELGDMPEFGVMLKMSADYDRLTWYGYGPDDCYADRMPGAKLGLWTGTAGEQMAKYLMPQECGNKAGVRMAKVTDARGRGLLFAAQSGEGMNFSALPYTPHEIENAMHPFELPKVHYTVVRLSLAQMGVGGDDSWGALTLPEYLVDASEPMRFTFAFRGI